MKRSYLFIAALIGVAVLFFWGYFPTLSKYQDLKFQEEEIDHKLKMLNDKIHELQEEKQLLQNDTEYLEKVIRGELGLVKPGEIVYKFVEIPPASRTPVPAKIKAAPPSLEPAAEAAAGVSQTKAPNIPSVSAPASVPPQAPKSQQTRVRKN